MREDEIVLTPGSSGDDEGNGWFPAVLLQHGATRSELYVIVGETVEGMAEDVPEASWLDIQRRWDEGLRAKVERLRAAIEAHREGMMARFAETQGDPNEHDTALWEALNSEEST